MKQVSTLIIRSMKGCALQTEGGFTELTAGVPLLIPVPEEGSIRFCVWPLCRQDGSIPVPEYHFIRLSQGRVEGSTARIYDWNGVYEAEVEPHYFKPGAQESKLLDKADYYFGERKAAAELYLDGGVRLAVSPYGAEPFSMPIGPGEGGGLRVFDTGGERLLAVRVFKEAGQRLVLIDRSASVVLDLEADEADVAEGYPFTVMNVDPVIGLQRRVRYVSSGGAFKAEQERAGWFTSEKKPPVTEQERAFAFLEYVKYGSWDELDGIAAKVILSDRDALSEFVGDFSELRPYPVEEPPGRVTAGAISEKSLVTAPRRLSVVFEDGLVCDVAEL